MVRSYTGAGMFVILSMIYDFPMENTAAREATRSLVARIADPARMAFIFNRFALFHTSAIFKEPARHGIAEVEPRQPRNDIQYVFGWQRESPADSATAEEARIYQALKFAMCPETYAALCEKHGAALLEMAYFLDYNSIGFTHRVRHNTTVLASLLSRESAQPV